MNDMNRLRNKLAELVLAFPNKEIPAETIALYAQRLSMMPADAVCMAIDRLMDTARFFPTIAEIKEEAAAGPFGAPLADEAWAEVLKEARRVGYNRLPIFHAGQFHDPPKREFSNPTIEAAVQSVGWEMICTTPKDKISYVRDAFVKAFNALQHRTQEARQTGALPLDEGRIEIVALPGRKGDVA
jgi:hypothetical protein